MDRRVLILLASTALPALSTACIDWDSLYATAGVDGGNDSTTPDAHEEPNAAGCSDGIVEVIELEAPEGGDFQIVACGGAWLVPGVVNSEETTCGRQAGDDLGDTTTGEGCSVGDLCAAGWHVCLGAADVLAHQGSSLCERLREVPAATYVTRQGGQPGDQICPTEPDPEPGAANDVYGCGTLGIESPDCVPLDRRLAAAEDGAEGDTCPSPFNCGEDPANEGANIIKTESSGGGALCCHD